MKAAKQNQVTSTDANPSAHTAMSKPRLKPVKDTDDFGDGSDGVHK